MKAVYIILFALGIALLIGGRIMEEWKGLRYPYMELEGDRKNLYSQSDYKLYAVISGLELGAYLVGTIWLLGSAILFAKLNF